MEDLMDLVDIGGPGGPGGLGGCDGAHTLRYASPMDRNSMPPKRISSPEMERCGWFPDLGKRKSGWHNNHHAKEFHGEPPCFSQLQPCMHASGAHQWPWRDPQSAPRFGRFRFMVMKPHIPKMKRDAWDPTRHQFPPPPVPLATSSVPEDSAGGSPVSFTASDPHAVVMQEMCQSATPRTSRAAKKLNLARATRIVSRGLGLSPFNLQPGTLGSVYTAGAGNVGVYVLLESGISECMWCFAFRRAVTQSKLRVDARTAESTDFIRVKSGARSRSVFQSIMISGLTLIGLGD